MMRFFPVAASRRKTSQPPDRVPQRQPRSKRVAGSQRRHVMPVHVPRRRRKSRNQPSGKNSARLQRSNAENLAQMFRIIAPLVNDVENLRAKNSAQHHQNSQVP